MKRRATKRTRREDGYALMLAVFLTSLMLIAAIVAAPSVRTERQREKEQEMIWRGKQYVRGIKMYYRKNGRFPTNLDDLIKPQLGGIRYLRQKYKDPMNKEDGSWRLIYVGPMGQLVGSTKPPQNIQFQAGSGAGAGSQPAGQPQGNTGSTFGGGFGSSQPQQGTTGSQPGTTRNGPGSGQQDNGGNTAQPGAPGSTTGQGSDAPAPVDTSNFVGGNIIGVGSKAEKDSVQVYEKATNYHQFEFIWDPSKDALVIGGSGQQVGTPVAPGQNPAGQFGSPSPPQPGTRTQPGNPTSSQPDMPLTPNNPPPQ
jgi:hypothetical protein